jgi:hypothetical protein
MQTISEAFAAWTQIYAQLSEADEATFNRLAQGPRNRSTVIRRIPPKSGPAKGDGRPGSLLLSRQELWQSRWRFSGGIDGSRKAVESGEQTFATIGTNGYFPPRTATSTGRVERGSFRQRVGPPFQFFFGAQFSAGHFLEEAFLLTYWS